MKNTITQVQEVFFNLSDLIDSGQIDDFRLEVFQKFLTLREFLEEQKSKLQSIEEDLQEVSDETRSYGPCGAPK